MGLPFILPQFSEGGGGSVDTYIILQVPGGAISRHPRRAPCRLRLLWGGEGYTTTTKKTEEWFSENALHFIPKRKHSSSSTDLNRPGFGIWSYLESKVSATHHQSLEALKVKLQKKWAN